ncbi:carboxylating nicotinate-nucleotide diphosphorylase [Staphylococcus lutrae]|uniref:Probable nicotinate-nucleotide pyrophosphorylase [carboxylating] n=1 Tax=Staphylococcus lutrae TaxID=155085 RepID=A0AAC9RSI3_9STAP|nr:carboxylating nicotinate-nucleotide diphosphorylase [Staphylococcus lutrae]ARJ50854.1 nicotinate-nucleotide diphosphorylase (carboxylating) [Staphylococcus lutrae]PNZ39841.1 nicotinate-nucleotide diphosphorylase (carboxylating) [Staphylococcus lutrae]
MLNRLLVKEKLQQFYIEDNQQGDLATRIFDRQTQGTLTLISKAPGIFCGTDIIEEGFKLLEPTATVEMAIAEGAHVTPGTVIARITAPIYALLTMERIVLNLIQRMSGIATMTHQMVTRIAHTTTRLVDTRKTTPGLAIFEKYAVTVGGGLNHRRSLNDGLMLKDNHIDYSTSITAAIQEAKKWLGPMDKIEVEIENEAMLIAAVQAGVDIIMFDNCTPEWIKAHIHHVPASIQTEASGNITEANITDYAATGVDFISMGALFYGQKALDISAKVVI